MYSPFVVVCPTRSYGHGGCIHRSLLSVRPGRTDMGDVFTVRCCLSDQVVRTWGMYSPFVVVCPTRSYGHGGCIHRSLLSVRPGRTDMGDVFTVRCCLSDQVVRTWGMYSPFVVVCPTRSYGHGGCIHRSLLSVRPGRTDMGDVFTVRCCLSDQVVATCYS